PPNLHIVSKHSRRGPSIFGVPGRTPLRTGHSPRRSRQEATMARQLRDPTFYPSPRLAIEAPTETLAYVALLSTGENGTKDALRGVDTDTAAAHHGTVL